MAKAKTKAKRKLLPKKPNDTALIRACVTYAQSVAAQRDGFRADPDGNSEHAAALGTNHGNRAWQALLKILDTPATTPEGLCSKARIIPIVYEDNEAGCLTEQETSLIIGFADEVKKFLQPICDGHLKLGEDTPGRREERETDERIREALS